MLTLWRGPLCKLILRKPLNLSVRSMIGRSKLQSQCRHFATHGQPNKMLIDPTPSCFHCVSLFPALKQRLCPFWFPSLKKSYAFDKLSRFCFPSSKEWCKLLAICFLTASLPTMGARKLLAICFLASCFLTFSLRIKPLRLTSRIRPLGSGLS